MPKGIPRNISVQHKVLHRLAIARGHLDRVIEMVERGDYCIDVINQSQAVQSALKHADQVLLKNHLETCVAEEIKKGHTKEIIKEVMEIMDKKSTGHVCCCGTCTCENCACTCDKDKHAPCDCKCKDCTCNKK